MEKYSWDWFVDWTAEQTIAIDLTREEFVERVVSYWEELWVATLEFNESEVEPEPEA